MLAGGIKTLLGCTAAAFDDLYYIVSCLPSELANDTSIGRRQM